jgi:ABC-2 type transport system permease protein
VLFDIDALGDELYGDEAHRIFFEALSPDLLAGATLSSGDTAETLDGDARHYLIAVESDEETLKDIRKALRKSKAKGLLPASRRFVEDDDLEDEPLTVAGRFDKRGNLKPAHQDLAWVRDIWKEMQAEHDGGTRARRTERPSRKERDEEEIEDHAPSGTPSGFMRSLHTLWSIFKHEFVLYWISPVAYLVGGAWLLMSGFFFSLSLASINQPAGPFGGGGLEPSMIYTLSPMAFLLMFLAPALTMRLVADEVRSGTHELLMTSPVRDWEIIVAKWLGVWAVFTVFILLTLPLAFLLLSRGTPDRGLMAAGYIGYWLWAGAVLAVGVLTSSISQYQLVAFMIGEGIALLLFLADQATAFFPGTTMSEVLGELTLTNHYQRSMLFQGIIKPIDVAYFVGLIAICLFLATQILSMRRWRA